MKKGKHLLAFLSATVIALSSVPGIGVFAADQCDQFQKDGYDCELWNQDYQGTANWTVGNGGTYECSWSGIKNVLFRTGKKWASNPTPWKSLDGIKMEYEAEYYQPNGNSYLAVYGWTKQPLAEYYIVENYGSWRPPGTGGGMQMVGEITVNDGTYEVYKGTHDGPSIENGVTHFNQYWSVRKDGQLRSKGTIDIDAHFAAWEQYGIEMGGLYEVALVTEGYMSSGKSKIVKNNITLGGGSTSTGTTEPKTPEPTVTYTKPSGSGTGVTDNFEGTGTSWGVRGESCKYGFSSDMVHGGTQALYVEGRTGAWNGFTCQSSELIAGHSYEISAYAGYLSNNYPNASFTLGVMYNKSGSSSTTYDNRIDAAAVAGEWTKLAGTFEIPSGATDIALYVQTKYTESPTSADLIPFFLDDVILKDKQNGTAVTTGPDETTTPSGGSSVTTKTTASAEGIAAHQNNDYTYNPDGDGFKDYMGKYFRLGTCVSAKDIQDTQIQQFILKNFNSITCENEMKPENICDRYHSSGDNIAIKLDNAAPILSFCEKNGIGLRGHTFVWYSQTPGWIFNENFADNGAMVSPERMNARLESMIKNTFAAIKEKYPNLKLYAYDVCNELFKNDGGGFRGDGGEYSNWWSCYKSDEFVIKAFEYARMYAPEGCKLYMNDYNEYFALKSEDLYNMAKKIQSRGDFIDGIGMQSHMHYCDFGLTGSAYESKDKQFDTYAGTIDKFNSLGLDVQITELDVTTCSKDQGKNLFIDIFKCAMERGARISSLTLWGPCDSHSWRQSYTEDDAKYNNGQKTQGGNPLPFDASFQAKDFYYDIIALADEIVLTTTAAPQNILLGDVNCNGEVELTDAIMLAKAAAGIDVGMTAESVGNADINKNGKADNNDLTLLLKFISGIIDDFSGVLPQA